MGYGRSLHPLSPCTDETTEACTGLILLCNFPFAVLLLSLPRLTEEASQRTGLLRRTPLPGSCHDFPLLPSSLRHGR